MAALLAARAKAGWSAIERQQPRAFLRGSFLSFRSLQKKRSDESFRTYARARGYRVDDESRTTGGGLFVRATVFSCGAHFGPARTDCGRAASRQYLCGVG